jgi:F-type H+-transporting ATPase subunit alpha
MKAFEEAFLREMDVKMPDLLADFKKGALPEEGLAKMTKLVQDLIPQFKA